MNKFLALMFVFPMAVYADGGGHHQHGHDDGGLTTQSQTVVVKNKDKSWQPWAAAGLALVGGYFLFHFDKHKRTVEEVEAGKAHESRFKFGIRVQPQEN